MKVLIILNDPAYGIERSYSGLRLSSFWRRPESMLARSRILKSGVLIEMNTGLRRYDV